MTKAGRAANASRARPAPTPLTKGNDSRAGAADRERTSGDPQRNQDGAESMEERRPKGPRQREEVRTDDRHHPGQTELTEVGPAAQQRRDHAEETGDPDHPHHQGVRRGQSTGVGSASATTVLEDSTPGNRHTRMAR